MGTIVLTEDQETAITGLLKDVRTPGSRPVLCGYAGTGKTVTTAALVSRLRQQGLNVVVATPTHKARSQVESALTSYGVKDFEATTVHRLLGLKLVRDYATGEERFEPDSKGSNMLNPKKDMPATEKVDVVIVDETSMVNSQLYALLCMEAGDRPVIFVGDDRQLLPVGEDSVCKAFTEATSTYRLTKVLRHDGAILNLATQTRKLGAGRAKFATAIGEDSKVIAYSEYEIWKGRLLDLMGSAEAMDNPDYCRALAWTNSAVVQMNKIIHECRYGADAPQFVEGMTCVTVDAVANPKGGAPLIGSTVDVLIEGAVRYTIRLPGDEVFDPLWKVWHLKVSLATGPDNLIELKVLDKSEEARWKEGQKGLASKAKRSKDAKERKENWKLYFQRADMLAKLEPSSALTIHKSQGSTFKNVFLHFSIDWAETPEIQNQLAYVGITRASECLHVVKG